jgi:hypothetical protein
MARSNARIGINWNRMNKKRSVLNTHGSTTGAKNTALP